MNDLKKKVENIWFYYKVPIIIGTVLLYLFISYGINKTEEPKYDYNIAIISENNYPSEENVEKLKNIFSEKYDGTVGVNIYNVTLGEVGQDEVILSKLSLDLGNKISELFFIEDMDTFKKTTADIEFSDVVLVSNVDWLSNLGLDNFYFATRK